MQAGESLSFIQTRHELSTPETLSPDEAKIAESEFSMFAMSLLNSNVGEVQAVHSPEEDNLVMVVEKSLYIPFNDGSYLHVVAFAHILIGDPFGWEDATVEDRLLNLNLSIVEHTPTGANKGGFLYQTGDDKLTCIRLPAVNIEIEDDIDEDHHFSIVDVYKSKLAVFRGLNSPDEEVRMQAEGEWRHIKEEVDLGAYERELGFDYTTPTLDDIQQLAGLMYFAKPFQAPDARRDN